MLLVGGIALAVTLVMTAVVLNAVADQRRSADEARNAIAVQASAARAARLLAELQVGSRGYIITGRESFLAPWKRAVGEIPAETDRLVRITTDPAQRELALRLRADLGRFVRTESIPTVTLARRDRAAARRIVQQSSGAQSDGIRALYDRFDQTEAMLAADRRERAARDADRERLLVILAALLFAGLVIGLTYALQRLVVRPVERVADAMQEVRAGDLETRVAVSGGGEIRMLERGFNAMAGGLAEARESAEARREELERSNADLEQFAYVASHDLGEPLRVVAGFSELLERRYKGQLDERADRYIAHIVDAVTRMRELIDDLLEYARVGRADRPFTQVDLGDVMEQVRRSLASRIADRDGTLEVGPLPGVHGDERQLGQLLQNLCANALKFSRDGVPPVVRVRAARNGKAWQVSVADNGIGMAPEHQDRVFQMFQRLHSREHYEGTGIGLAICEKIVTRHGGTIDVESEEGAGSTFTFTLPDPEEGP
jgi:signal transduction histidine kinase